jgi:GNAT superfamily N-acetyltransferase
VVAAVIRAAEPADAPAIARVHIASWQSAYRGLLPDAYLDGLSATLPERTARWEGMLWHPASPDNLTVLAELPGPGLVGFAKAGAERRGRPDFDCELHAIYLLAAHQRAGLGRALFTRCCDHLRGLGRRRMIAWMLRGNPAGDFYAALGGEPMRGLEEPGNYGGITVMEIAYAWDLPGT